MFVGAAALFCTQAMAQSMLVEPLGAGPGRTVLVTTGGLERAVFAGQLRDRISGATGESAWMNGERVAYSLYPGPQVTQTLTHELMSVSAAIEPRPFSDMRSLVIEQYFNNAQHLAADPASSPDFAAAFQLAVWEAATDYDPTVGPSSLSLATGSFTARRSNGTAFSQSFMGLFNTLVQNIFLLPDAGYRVSAFASAHSGGFVVPRQVPEPGAIVLGLLGGVTMMRRRR
jgi:hypothetical protein